MDAEAEARSTEKAYAVKIAVEDLLLISDPERRLNEQIERVRRLRQGTRLKLISSKRRRI